MLVERMFSADRRPSRERPALSRPHGQLSGITEVRWCTDCSAPRTTVIALMAESAGTARDAPALVLSTDPVAAALVGALVETLGFEPRFEVPGKSPREALRRHRPRIVLLDCEHGNACSPTFLGPAAMLDIPVVLFGSARCAELLADSAARFGLPALTLPASPQTVGRVIADAIAGTR